MILKEKYKNYENALLQLNLETLKERRNILSLKFAKSGLKHKTLTDLFPKQEINDFVKTRKHGKFKVNFANTERLKNASIIFMPNQLNSETE